MAAKLPAAAITDWTRARGVPLDEPDREGAEPGAEGDQRPLGPEHHAQAQGGKGREHDAGKVDQGQARLRPP